MVSKTGVLTVKILGDAKPFQKTMGGVEKQTASFGASATKFGKVAATGLAVAGAAAVGLGAEVLNTGAKLTSWRQKTTTVFEGSAKDVRKWADANNEAFGATDDEVAGLAASFGDLLKPMGFTAKQAADMAMDVVGLSGALSEWSGGQKSAAEVSDILAKAMLGERDGLKQLGIAISEADVQARLAANGQDKLTGAALEQAKAMATQELIMEKSTDAQAAYAEGGNAAIRAQNGMKAAVDELREQFADKLLPVVTAITQWAADRLPAAMDSAQAAFKGVVGAVQNVIDVFQGDGLAGVFNLVVESVQKALPGLIKKLAEWGKAFAAWVAPMIPPLLVELGKALVAIGRWFVTTALPAIAAQLAEWGKAFVTWVAPRISPLLAELGRLLVALGGWLVNTALPAIARKLGEWASAFVAWVGPKIPKLLLELGKLLLRVGDWLLTTALPNITRKLGEWAWAFVKWVGPKIPKLLAELVKLQARIGGWIVTEALPAIVRQLGKWAGAFLAWVGDAAAQLPGKLTSLWTNTLAPWFSRLPGKILAGLGNLGSMLLSKGKELIQGFINGVKEKAAGIASAIKAAVVGAVRGIPLIGDRAASWLQGAIGDGPGKMLAGSAMMRAQALATGLPLRMSSGYRTPSQNAAAGGSPTSYHLDRNNPASDWVGPTWALDEFAARLRKVGGWRELLWRVPNHAPGDNPHVHVADEGGVFKGPGYVWMGAGRETFASGLSADRVAPLPANGQGGVTAKIIELLKELKEQNARALSAARPIIVEDRSGNPVETARSTQLVLRMSS